MSAAVAAGYGVSSMRAEHSHTPVEPRGLHRVSEGLGVDWSWPCATRIVAGALPHSIGLGLGCVNVFNVGKGGAPAKSERGGIKSGGKLHRIPSRVVAAHSDPGPCIQRELPLLARDCEFAAAPGSGHSSCWLDCPMAAVSAPWEHAVAARRDPSPMSAVQRSGAGPSSGHPQCRVEAKACATFQQPPANDTFGVSATRIGGPP